jgi:hypothetical protein
MKRLSVLLMSTVLGALLSFGTPGCKAAGFKETHAQSADAAVVMTTSSAAAPFASPPVLKGTPDVAALVAKVNPTVVNITTVHEIRQPNFDFDFPFDFFGGPMALTRSGPRSAITASHGRWAVSGFVAAKSS